MTPPRPSGPPPAFPPFILTAEQPVVHWLPIDDTFDLHHWQPLLDGDELSRAERLRLAPDRVLFVAAHGLARRLLGACTGVAPARLRFAEDPNGKPLLAGHPSIGFSLTHTRGLVACAVARDTVIGIDAEFRERGEWTAEVARSHFSAEEARLLDRAEEEEGLDLFYRLWTLKEAFVKATGAGMTQPLDGITFDLSGPSPRLLGDDRDSWTFRELLPTPDHRLALAVRRPDVTKGRDGPR